MTTDQSPATYCICPVIGEAMKLVKRMGVRSAESLKDVDLAPRPASKASGSVKEAEP